MQQQQQQQQPQPPYPRSNSRFLMLITFYHLGSHQPRTCHPRAFTGSGAFARAGAAFGAGGLAVATTLAAGALAFGAAAGAGALAVALQCSQYSWHHSAPDGEKDDWIILDEVCCNTQCNWSCGHACLTHPDCSKRGSSFRKLRTLLTRKTRSRTTMFGVTSSF